MGCSAVFCSAFCSVYISVLILSYFDLRSFSTLDWMELTACSMSEPLTSVSYYSGSRGTPAMIFCMSCTKAVYSISLVLMSSRALTSWSVAPALT